MASIGTGSDFVGTVGTGNVVVRSSSGDLYVPMIDVINDDHEVWKSTDEGVTWVEQDTGNKHSQTSSSGYALAVIDSSDVIHIIYVNNSAGSSTNYYQTFDTTNDTFGTSNSNVPSIDNSQGVAQLEMVIDSNDELHVAYVAIQDDFQDTVTLGYINNVGGSWNTRVTIEGPTTFTNASHPSIVLDSSDVPYISAEWDEGLKVYEGNATNATSFTSHVLDGDNGSGTAIQVDSNDHVIVFSQEFPSSDMFVHTHDGGTWTTGWTSEKIVDTAGYSAAAVNSAVVVGDYLFAAMQGAETAYGVTSGEIVLMTYHIPSGDNGIQSLTSTANNGAISLKRSNFNNYGSDGTEYGRNYGIPEIDYVYWDNTDMVHGTITLNSFDDTFTGADDTVIDVHEPDSGPATHWLEQATTSSILHIQTNEAEGSGSLSDGSVYTAEGVYGNDYSVVAEVGTSDSGDDTNHVRARFTDIDNNLSLSYNEDTLILRKRVSGTWTDVLDIGTDSSIFVDDGDDIGLKVAGTAVDVIKNGSSIGTYTITDTVLETGRAGFSNGGGTGNPVSGDDVSAQTITRFTITPISNSLSTDQMIITYTTPSGAEVIQRFNGSTFSDQNIQYFNGSSFSSKTVKRYNGSTWDEIT